MRSERITAYFAGSFLIGILLARTKNPLWILPAMALAAFLCAAAHFAGNPRRKLPYLLLVGTAVLLGILRYSTENAFRERYLPYIKDGTEIRVQGLVYQKEFKNQNSIYYLKKSLIQLDQIKAPTNQIQVYLDSDRYPVGATLLVEGTVKEFTRPRNEGNFDQKLFMESRKIDLCVYGKKAREVGERRLPLERTLHRIRERMRSAYENATTGLDAGILSAMLLGDKTALSGEVKELYQASGISHILAISGLHISLIGAAFLWILKLMRLPRGPAALIAAVFMGCYVMMTGAAPSALRAYIMFLLALLSPILRRTYDSVTALSVALILLLWENPFLTGYSGFVFSFSAVLSVTAYGRVLALKPAKKEEPLGLREKAKCLLKKRMEAFKSGIMAGFALQLVTLPVVMWNYYEVPLFALALNLLIIPFLGILLSFGAIGGVAGLMGFLPFSRLVLLIPHFILYVYGHCCRIAGRLPGAELITGKPEGWMVAVYYAVLTGAFFLAELFGKKRLTLLPALLLVLILVVPKSRGFELSFLDVGQGDGIYIASSGGTAFVDGGSTSVKQVGKYRIEPFLKCKGVKKVDFWLVTHTDQDHISGLSELLEEGYSIEKLVFSEYVYQDEALEELIALAKEKGTEILYMKPGQSIHLGETVLRCLFPGSEYISREKNSLSLVTVLEEGECSAILTGDISDLEETYLVKRGEVPDIDLYKASHHGSRYGSSREFLEKLSPELAVISCGAGNRYGHPAKETLGRIKESGAKIYDTRFHGQIKVRLQGGRFQVSEMTEK